MDLEKQRYLQSLSRGQQTTLTVREQFVMASLAGTWFVRPAGLCNWIRWALGLDYRGVEMRPEFIAKQSIAIADEVLRQLKSEIP